MRIHILGICGTFMGGVAAIAKQLGHDVTGTDANVYPPMSDQLRALGIELFTGYDAKNLAIKPDLVIVGNAIGRGNPELEAVLNENLAYISAPQWLFEQVLKDRWVLAVAGTHGKTSVTSMLAWMLEFAGKKPGFLIGGVPSNFKVSAQLGESPYFVIEADEYDSAYFDKRSKFIHYHPKTLILNNLEFDHADIFDDLNAIKKQFHHLVRTVPGNGAIIKNVSDGNLTEVLAQGCWSSTIGFNDDDAWQAKLLNEDGSQFAVYFKEQLLGELSWDLFGRYNVSNALAAIAAANHVGIDPTQAMKALTQFKNTKRRMEVKGVFNGVTVYDDFAHHPTAIYESIQALRCRIGDARLMVVLEFGSYTMRCGLHALEDFAQGLNVADQIYLKQPRDQLWDAAELKACLTKPMNVADSVDRLVDELVQSAKPGDYVLVMSNTGFNGLFDKLREGFAHVA